MILGGSLSPAMVGTGSYDVHGRRCLLEGTVGVLCSSPLSSLTPTETSNPCSLRSDDEAALHRFFLVGIVLGVGIIRRGQCRFDGGGGGATGLGSMMVVW